MQRRMITPKTSNVLHARYPHNNTRYSHNNTRYSHNNTGHNGTSFKGLNGRTCVDTTDITREKRGIRVLVQRY